MRQQLHLQRIQAAHRCVGSDEVIPNGIESADVPQNAAKLIAMPAITAMVKIEHGDSMRSVKVDVSHLQIAMTKAEHGCRLRQSLDLLAQCLCDFGQIRV